MNFFDRMRLNFKLNIVDCSILEYYIKEVVLYKIQNQRHVLILIHLVCLNYSKK